MVNAKLKNTIKTVRSTDGTRVVKYPAALKFIN